MTLTPNEEIISLQEIRDDVNMRGSNNIQWKMQRDNGIQTQKGLP